MMQPPGVARLDEKGGGNHDHYPRAFLRQSEYWGIGRVERARPRDKVISVPPEIILRRGQLHCVELIMQLCTMGDDSWGEKRTTATCSCRARSRAEAA